MESEKKKKKTTKLNGFLYLVMAYLFQTQNILNFLNAYHCDSHALSDYFMEDY